MRLLFLCVMIIMASCKQGPTDAQLHDQIAGMINPTSPGVTVTVNDGVVTLGGTCPDESCKHVSESAAKGIKGVKQVVNNIVVSPPAEQSHVEITADDPLKDSVNSLLSAYKTVKANVENGTVTLTGEIKRSQLTPLMQSVNELKPKKVVNNLVIK